MRRTPLCTAPAIRPLAWLLRSIPDRVHVELAGGLASGLLRWLGAAERLDPIEGRSLALVIEDTGNTWRLRVEGGRLRPAGPVLRTDVCIRGTLADFVRLALRAEDPDTLFFARSLRLEGDTETGLHLKNLLDSLDLEWEGQLEALLGSAMGPAAAAGVRRTGLDRLLRPLAREARRVAVGALTPRD